MTDQQRTMDFEGRLDDAVWSYSGEGVRAFDAAAISVAARSGGGGGLGWAQMTPGHRRAVGLLLLAAAISVALVVAVAGSRRAGLLLPASGVMVVGANDQLLAGDVSSRRFTALTPTTPHDANPVWSPDGRRIAFDSHDGRGPVAVVDADGTNRRVLTPGFGSSVPVAWSPDGSRIAFAGYRYPGVAEPGIWIVNADGTDAIRVYASANNPGQLAWSPDGSTLAFVQFEGDHSFVHLLDVGTRAVTTLTSPLVDHHEETAPLAWQPGRTALLYARAGRGLRHDLVLVERTGSTWTERPIFRDLAPGTASAAWLDGNRFVFLRHDGIEEPTSGGVPTVARIDGTLERSLADAAIEPGTVGCVAPDGSAVAYPVATGPTGDDGTAPPVELVIFPTDGRPAFRMPAVPWISGEAACSWRAS